MYGARRNKKADGGLITGPGTGTSDSISTEMPEGTYILPADTTQSLGFGARRPQLEAQPQPGFGARRGRVPVQVSNGEFEVTPDQVHAIGVQALDQVRDSTHSPAESDREAALAGIAQAQGRQDAAQSLQDRTSFFANGGEVGFGVRGYKDWKAKQDAAEIPNYGNFGARRKQLADGGLVGDPTKPKQTSFDATNTPTAPATASTPPAVPGNAERAKQMQAQYQQPVVGPRGAVGQAPASAQAQPPAQPGFGEQAGNIARANPAMAPFAPGSDTRAVLSGAADDARTSFANGQYATGIGYGVRGLAAAPFAVAADAARSAGRLVQPGLDAVTEFGRGVAGAGVPPTPAPSPVQAGKPPTQGPVAPGAQPAPGADGWTRTGFGVGAPGGEVAARIGRNGTAEFSNDPAAVAGASVGTYGNFGARRTASAPAQPGYGAYRRTPEQLAAMAAPGGGQVLSAGTNSPTPEQELAATGSAANLGNGVGTFSQAQAGDSKLAMERFERANQERQRMVETAQRGELGNNGGQLNVVRDSSRAPSRADLQNARLDNELAQTDVARQQSQTSTALANQRIASEAQQMGSEALNQQRLQQQVQEGQYGLADQQRINTLKAAMADPSLSQDQRAQAQQAYTYLTTPAKDRYRTQDVILGRDETGKDIRGTQLFDVTTGQPVAEATQQSAVMPPAAAVQALKQNPQRAAEFDAKYGAGAAAKYLQG